MLKKKKVSDLRENGQTARLAVSNAQKTTGGLKKKMDLRFARKAARSRGDMAAKSARRSSGEREAKYAARSAAVIALRNLARSLAL